LGITEADENSKFNFIHMRFKNLFLLLCLIPLACLTRKEQPQPPAIIALVNGIAIKETQLRFRINLESMKYEENHVLKGKQFEGLKTEILNRMIDHRIIIDWGAQNNILLTENEKAEGIKNMKKGYTDHEFDMMLEERGIPYSLWTEMAEENIAVAKIIHETLMKKNNVSSEEVLQYYQKNIKDYAKNEQYRARHIVTDTLEKAQELHKRLLKGENFAKLAIMNSLSPDRANGGDLGFFEKGTHPVEFDQAVEKLEISELSPVIKSPYGYHIFKLIDKKPKQTQPFLEVGQEIRATLFQKKLAAVYESWIEELRIKAQISIIDETLENFSL